VGQYLRCPSDEARRIAAHTGPPEAASGRSFLPLDANWIRARGPCGDGLTSDHETPIRRVAKCGGHGSTGCRALVREQIDRVACKMVGCVKRVGWNCAVEVTGRTICRLWQRNPPRYLTATTPDTSSKEPYFVSLKRSRPMSIRRISLGAGHRSRRASRRARGGQWHTR